MSVIKACSGRENFSGSDTKKENICLKYSDLSLICMGDVRSSYDK